MTAQDGQKRLSTRDIALRKGPGSIVSLTAYTAPIARIMDPFTDLILIGDSLGMVVYGMDNTLDVSVAMMIRHGRAVMSATRHSCVIVDMPFASYQESPQQAFRNSARVLKKTGAQGVKLEGGKEMAATVEFLVRRGIPVATHIGLMPQHRHVMGGFKAQGLTPESRASVYEDAMALKDSGSFCMIIEGTSEPLARRITAELAMPTIGIGASPACDGQILVVDDILGMFADFRPRFAKTYANLHQQIGDAVRAYADDVRAGRFPENRHCFDTGKKS